MCKLTAAEAAYELVTCHGRSVDGSDNPSFQGEVAWCPRCEKPGG